MSTRIENDFARGLDMIKQAMTPKRGLEAGIDHLPPAVADGNGPECCANCVRWGGLDNDIYGWCPLVRMDTADSSVCSRFQLKATL